MSDSPFPGDLGVPNPGAPPADSAPGLTAATRMTKLSSGAEISMPVESAGQVDSGHRIELPPHDEVYVFTREGEGGNPLAVFFLDDEQPVSEYLRWAEEKAYSEIVIALPPEHEDSTAKVRIFTTEEELPFAGHPILGTAAILMAKNPDLAGKDIRIETKKGVITVNMGQDGPLFVGSMSQPVPTHELWDQAAALLLELKLSGSLLPVELYDNGVPHIYVEAETPEAVHNIAPDFEKLGGLCGEKCVNIFAVSDGIVTLRTLVPSELGKGMPEDAACGSAAGALAAHLLRHGKTQSGEEITILQGDNIGRPSELRAAAFGEGDTVSEVRVGGSIAMFGE